MCSDDFLIKLWCKTDPGAYKHVGRTILLNFCRISGQTEPFWPKPSFFQNRELTKILKLSFLMGGADLRSPAYQPVAWRLQAVSRGMDSDATGCHSLPQDARRPARHPGHLGRPSPWNPRKINEIDENHTIFSNEQTFGHSVPSVLFSHPRVSF